MTAQHRNHDIGGAQRRDLLIAVLDALAKFPHLVFEAGVLPGHRLALHSKRLLDERDAGTKGAGLLGVDIDADGSFRDTVVFSILADEWPEVRKGLEARINR